MSMKSITTLCREVCVPKLTQVWLLIETILTGKSVELKTKPKSVKNIICTPCEEHKFWSNYFLR